MLKLGDGSIGFIVIVSLLLDMLEFYIIKWKVQGGAGMDRSQQVSTELERPEQHKTPPTLHHQPDLLASHTVGVRAI